MFATIILTNTIEEVRTRFAASSLVDLDLVQRCGENLAAIVVGEQEPLEIVHCNQITTKQNQKFKFRICL